MTDVANCMARQLRSADGSVFPSADVVSSDIILMYARSLVKAAAFSSYSFHSPELCYY